MSYENTQCPCRGQKLPETMLCPDCETAVAGTYDRREMDNPAAPLEARRAAAIRILAVSRRRLSSTGAPSPASVSSVCSVGTS
jgi:hypothetical protein